MTIGLPFPFFFYQTDDSQAKYSRPGHAGQYRSIRPMDNYSINLLRKILRMSCQTKLISSSGKSKEIIEFFDAH